MARADRRTPLAVWGGVAAFAALFGTLSVRRHEAFSTARFDLGNMVQAVWSTAHGHPLRVTDLDGDQVLRLGAHVDPVLVLFAPLWWLWPSPNLLLVVQALAIALGAVPVYRLAQKHLRSSRAGTLFAFAYLLYPPTTWLALNEFHPGGLAMPALLWAFWYLDEDRLALFAVFALFAACSREDIPLVFIGFGIWYALAHGRRAVGVAIAIAGLTWTVLAVKVVIPHVRGGETAFVGRYGEAKAALGDPARTAAARLRSRWRPLPARPRSAARCAVAARADRAGRGSRARAQPSLRHAHADLDPLPLHGRDHSASRRGGCLRRGARAHALAVARRRNRSRGCAGRELSARGDPVVARASGWRDARVA